MKQKVTCPEKRYIVKKYIMAKSAHDALLKERRIRPDDVWLDENWKQEATSQQLESCIGFEYYPSYE
jgi:hypothetical protein